MYRAPVVIGTLALAAALATSACAPTDAAADLVVTGARIYTESPDHAFAQALAVRDGKIVFVGSDADARKWIRGGTRTVQLEGQLVLPGLIDSHIHPTGIVDLDVCDAKSEAKTLAQMTDFVRGCIARYKVPEGQWVHVRQWNFSDGNQPDAAHPTLRAALDAATTTHPVQLIGNDGHHSAFNSMALATARNAQGQVVGMSRATIARDFAKYRKLIGVDASGEPNGALNEEARMLTSAPWLLTVDLPDVAKVPYKITEKLNSVGITGILDAAVLPEILPVYDTLESTGKLTVRVAIAQFLDPENFRGAHGEVEYDRMLDIAKAVRAKYENDPLMRADTVKLFADGVLEGNPYAVPPTLPEVAALHPYLQPIFGKDEKGEATVTGYVDTDSALCRQVRAHLAKAEAGAQAFIRAHGYHPDQCIISSGQLQHDRAVEMEFVKRFHTAGFNVHIHAIGDAGVRTAVDAIEAARAADGNSATHDALAHVQAVTPEDQQRIGKDHLYLACTYSWANFDPQYDMLVVPFFDKVHGNDYAALHPAGGYYESMVYPFRSMKEAGAILLGGSDAPVNTRDPQPFVNMALAVSRALPNLPPITPAQRLTLQDAIDAYTINGARYLNRDKEAGSIEVGKSADFIVLDRDILKLAEAGQLEAVAGTHVLETYFRGKSVYQRPKNAPADAPRHD
ncbi:MAG: amidohydrolase family protein [Proteobacteria bacterium]|nr:amidohydrolase family protein [Pseudomonadota bacterium]